MSDRRRIIFVSYFFPPMGGAAAQRPIQLVRHLRDDGHEPILITGPGNTGGRWTPSDPSLATSVPEEIDIRRVPGPEPRDVSRWRSRSERWLGRRSEWARWWIDGVVDVAARVEGNVALVYTVISPYETTEACARIAAARGAPWVADLGDPWALDDMAVYPTGLHRRLELRRDAARGLESATGDRHEHAGGWSGGVRESARAPPEGMSGRPQRVRRGADFGEDAPKREPDEASSGSCTPVICTRSSGGSQEGAAVRPMPLLGGGVPPASRSSHGRTSSCSRRSDRSRREQAGAYGRRIEVHLAGVTTQTDEGRSPANAPQFACTGISLTLSP